MSVEKFIRGKKDSAHHEGRASTRRRQEAVLFSLKDFQRDYQEDILKEWEQEYIISQQILKYSRSPELVEFHKGRIEHHTPFLQQASILPKPQE